MSSPRFPHPYLQWPTPLSLATGSSTSRTLSSVDVAWPPRSPLGSQRHATTCRFGEQRGTGEMDTEKRGANCDGKELDGDRREAGRYTGRPSSGTSCTAGSRKAKPLERPPSPVAPSQVVSATRDVWGYLLQSVTLAEADEAGPALQVARDAAAAAAGAAAGLACPEDGNFLYLELAAMTNLGARLEDGGRYEEALTLYERLLSDKRLPESRKMLRANIGGVLLKQQKPREALKAYKAALDNTPLPAAGQGYMVLRARLLHSVASCHFSMGRYFDAADEYGQAIQLAPGESSSVASCLNLLLCWFAIGDAIRMQEAFFTMLTLRKEQLEMLESEVSGLYEVVEGPQGTLEPPGRAEADEAILKAARLLVASRGTQADSAYESIISALRQHGFEDLVGEVQLERAMRWLREGQVDPAIAAYKSFKPRSSSLVLRAATNLAFIFLLEGDLRQATTYAGMAVAADRTSAKALVNKGCCLSQRGELEEAAKLFEDAEALDPQCQEALYNLAVSAHKLGRSDEALEACGKLRRLASGHAEALFLLATIYEERGELPLALEALALLASPSIRPHDSTIWSRMGRLCSRLGRQQEALSHYREAYGLRPWGLEAVSWIGVHLVKGEAYSEAADYFGLASQLQPTESKWRLMAAVCLRKSGQLGPALTLYESLHRENPEDKNVLNGLSRTRAALGLQAE